MTTTYKKALSIAGWLILLLIVWQSAAYLLSDVIKDPLAQKKLPMLLDVGTNFKIYGLDLIRHAGITLSRAGKGFLWGTAIGIALALAMSLSGIVERIALPYLLASQMIPILGLAPIVFGLVKDIDNSRVVISAYITFFPVTLNMLSGFKSASTEHRQLMTSFAASKFALYRKLLIPFSVPYLFTGLKVSAPMAVTGAIFMDTLSARDGIGSIIVLTLYGGGTTGQFWPALIISALMGLFSFILVSLLEFALALARTALSRRERRLAL